MKKDGTKKHNFSIENSVWKKFKMICLERDTTATDVISEFIKNYVKKNERKIRQKK